uniref:RING-type E3 ubiquitin transferase n=1 Tax=Meloidogyne floridensis TaxID=298350 RepID=A0A915NJA1_9BILA
MFFLDQFNCVADYLLLSKNIKTRPFGQEIGNEWKIQQGISEMLAVGVTINRKGMEKTMGDKYTDECFKLNGLIKKDVFNVKFGNNVLEVRDILNKMENKYLILSKIYQKKLEKQASCLATFLLKIFGYNKEYLEEYIFNYYKFGEKNKVYKWKYFDKKFCDLNINFVENTKEYKELNKSVKIKIVTEGVSCRICLEEFEIGEFEQRLSCGHEFHELCILNWVYTKNEKEIGLIESKKGCPICRGKINIEGTSSP